MQATTKPSSARKFFSPRGLLSQWHGAHEFRSGQLEMAEAVEAALNEKKHLVVEAGTGTGKTLAYLIPAILTGRRVVISTGTKNLQEQIFYKDIPFLQEHLPEPIAVCYMKGRSNYLCRQKLIDAEKEPVLEGLEELADSQIIRAWEQTTTTGDRAEIARLPENSTAWAKLDARREACTGQKCPQYERCFITQMHQRAAASNLIIVNHHLFFADLALRDEAYAGGIIPEYAAVIFDEAHEIEDVAGQYFGVGVSSYQFHELRRDIQVLARRKDFGGEELDNVLRILEEYAERFFAIFGHLDGRTGFDRPPAFLEENEERYTGLQRALSLLATHLKLIEHQPEELIPLHRRTLEIGEALKFWMESSKSSYVYYAERRGRGTFLMATPIDVAPLLDERLFAKLDAVVLTSATLAVAGSFEFTERRLGLRYAQSMVVAGSFDYQEQALLYVPQQLPEPRSQNFAAAAAEEIARILEITDGRAFVLFTSYQQMRLVFDRVSAEVEFPTLLQGTAPRTALLDEFRGTPHCVLFATSSFWQGVDVQGDQLSCVIIDKLPFAVPNDPVVAARISSIREQGGNPFYDYQIPQAALSLKQGFGRLIRSRTDRGVLALLDNRITRQRYGQVFFDSLPDYSFTTDRRDVEKFFGK
jgi:ATP-dependent DNA helicase DinG